MKFELSEAYVQVILNALAEQPAKYVINVILELDKQVGEQRTLAAQVPDPSTTVP